MEDMVLLIIICIPIICAVIGYCIGKLFFLESRIKDLEGWASEIDIAYQEQPGESVQEFLDRVRGCNDRKP